MPILSSIQKGLGTFGTRGYPVALLVPVLAYFWIESVKTEKETCCYRNINYCDFVGRGMCRQGKERNRISNRIGNRIRSNFYFLINQNVSKLQITLMSLRFKAEKRVKKQEKKREDDLQRGKKQRTVILEITT